MGSIEQCLACSSHGDRCTRTSFWKHNRGIFSNRLVPGKPISIARSSSAVSRLAQEQPKPHLLETFVLCSMHCSLSSHVSEISFCVISFFPWLYMAMRSFSGSASLEAMTLSSFAARSWRSAIVCLKAVPLLSDTISVLSSTCQRTSLKFSLKVKRRLQLKPFLLQPLRLMLAPSLKAQLQTLLPLHSRLSVRKTCARVSHILQ